MSLTDMVQILTRNKRKKNSHQLSTLEVKFLPRTKILLK